MRRLVVAFCVASIVGACESATAPSLTVQKVSGSYALAEVDGHQLPYLSQTEAGDTIRSLANGSIALRADSSYQWVERWEYSHSVVDSSYTYFAPDTTVSAGQYSVGGGAVALRDSVSGALLKATLSSRDTLRVTFEGHHYAFAKVPAPSPEGAVWLMVGCLDSLGKQDYCPVLTNSNGAKRREVFGRLYVGSDSMVWAVPTPDSVAYVGPHRYGWIHAWERYDASGDSVQVQAVEFGSYTWDGTTFKTQPDDSSAFPASTGTFHAFLFLQQPSQTVLFVEFPYGLPD